MALVWGSWAGPSGQRERVGIDLSASGTTITEKYFIEAESSMNDNQSMKITGARSETVSFTANTPQAGAVQLVATRTRTGTRGTSYSYSATVTGIYTGATATVSNVSITVPAAPPSAPGQPSVSGVTSGKANIAWSAPSSNNGAAVTGYQIQFAYDSGFTAGVATGSASSASYTLTTTQSNTTFWVRVRAQNSAGYSSWSTARSFTTLPVAPAAPSGVSLTRVSDASQTVAWTNNATGAAPYAQVFVNRRDNVATSWVRVATLSGTPTSFTDNSTVANRRYEYIVAASNSGGTSGWTVSTAINTTPAAPSNVAAVKSGSNIAVSWTRNATYTGVTQHVIQDNPGGTGWVTVATVGAVDSWTHASVNASVTHQYRVLAKSTVNAVLDSAWSSPSAVVQLLAPPLAPTVLAPSGVLDYAKAIVWQWTHNPVDTTAQSQAQVQYRRVGQTVWNTETVTTATTASAVPTAVAGTIEFQIRTRGEHATYGPWSAVKTVALAAKPSVVINSPADGSTLDHSKVTVTWGYSSDDASPQAQWEASLYESGSLVEAANGSGTTASHTFARLLGDSMGYRVQVRVRSASGLWSAWSVSDFTTNFPVPVTVQPIPEWDIDTGSVSLAFTTPDTPETYAWTGVPHASPSTMTKDGVTLTNLANNGSFEGVNGTVEVRQNLHRDPLATSLSYWGKANEAETVLLGNGEALTTCSAGNVDSGLSLNAGTTLEANGVYTVSADVEALVDMTVRISVQGAGMTGNPENSSPSLVFAAGQKRRVWFTFTANAAGGPVNIYILRRTSSGSETWKTSKPLIEKSAMPRDYFDGSFSPDSDFVASWTGTVNGSASRLVGTTMHQVSPGSSRTRVVQSKQWAVDGESSARIIPFELDSGASSRDTFASPGGDTSGWRLGMAAGKTYTVVAYCRLAGPLTGTLHGDSRKIVSYWKAATGAYLNVGSTPAPNEEGVYVVRHTFTVPADATEAFIRLYNGASLGNGDVWWDAFTIVEGNHPDLMPFDGDTQSTTDVETITVQRQIGDGEWVTIAPNVPVDGAVVDPLPSLRYANRYRAISKTTLPTSADGPVAEIVWEPPATGTHIYLNGGPAFAMVCHVSGHIASEAPTLNSVLHHFGTSPHPVVYFGSERTDRLTFTGNLVDDSTPREEWLRLSVQPYIVCYRDRRGRREFGRLTLVTNDSAGVVSISGTLDITHWEEGISV